MYGEHSSLSAVTCSISGSPPRVRGAPDDRPERDRDERITPACTGSTPARSISRGVMPDHPRVYGEHAFHRARSAALDGSPPRVRGALHRDLRGDPGDRITPACTGSTTRRNTGSSGSTDHPRVYGEHLLQVVRPHRDTGSPPRVRGAPSRSMPSQPARWITPACTGSTSTPTRRPRPSADHPRVYGEHWKGLAILFLTTGSPPRVRGAPAKVTGLPSASWITPACTGSTYPASYPRS